MTISASKMPAGATPRPDDERQATQTPEQRLADAFAQRVQRWSLRAGATAADVSATADAARQLSLATSDGDVCIGLDDLRPLEGGPRQADGWRRALRASGIVGKPAQPDGRPLILDDGDRLYLHRYFDLERRLARRLMQAVEPSERASGESGATPSVKLRQADQFEPANAADVDWQALAAALALRGRLTVISGGPGTGKTTTVVQILARLLEREPDTRIALAAPTGKAAARMTEALRERAAHLPEALRERLPAESFTIHRLLGVQGDGSFAHDARHRLAVDLLVVDEASMLDLALATRLLEAVPDAARIVLLGDKDQLAAVEAGAVFADLCADPTLTEACRRDLASTTGIPVDAIVPAAPNQRSVLRDSVVWFSRSHRFSRESDIGRLAALVNGRHADEALAWLAGHGGSRPAAAAAGPDDTGVPSTSADAGAASAGGMPVPVHDGVTWIADDAPPLAPASVRAMEQGLEPYLQALQRDPGDVAAVSQAFGRFRVLCALREGPRGVRAINDSLTQRLRQRLVTADAGSPWFAGRPVLVTRNDHALKLFNGDVGLTLPDDQGQLQVHFPVPGGGYRAVAPARLPAHETALAMTVHKAQGSEFDDVLVVLPAQRSRVLTRELLYTAITRARHHVTLCAAGDVLREAIARGTQRRSGLLQRLRDCAEGAAAPREALPGNALR